MQDFSQLSSKTVTEVLMLEMKMAPAAKAYLISGYPRSMRDVVEYSEKVKFPLKPIKNLYLSEIKYTATKLFTCFKKGGPLQVDKFKFCRVL